MDKQTQLDLQALLDGELPEAKAREMTARVARDAEAGNLLAELRNTREALTGFEPVRKLPESREFYWSKIEREINRRQSATERTGAASVFALLRRFLMPASAVAALGICVTVAVVQSGISGNPDGVFVSYEALTAQRVLLVEGMEEGYLELEGSPDMVLEVVIRCSVRKDRVVLRGAYWEAGIREYWLVDARKPPLSFDILRYTAKRYARCRKYDGWIKSGVFQKSFRLTQTVDPLGHPEYTLEVR